MQWCMCANLRVDSFGGICSFIGCIVWLIACVFGMFCGVCRASRGSLNRTLFTSVGLTGAIRVRTFETGIWAGGIKFGGGIVVTGFGITGITTFGICGSCVANNWEGSTITGCDVGGCVGCATATVDNCFCVAANSSSNFRFFNSNNSRCFICNSVWICFSDCTKK